MIEFFVAGRTGPGLLRQAKDSTLRRFKMSFTIEKLEGSMAKITIEVEPEKVDAAITKAYHKLKNQISLPGFRKGKVPQNIAEKTYGTEIFYEDAANFMINDSYPEIFDELDEDTQITSPPEIDIEQIEKGKPFIYTALVAVNPEVTLGDYIGLEYTAFDASVTDEDVNKELEQTREMNSRRVPVEGRSAQMDDIVTIDYEGSVDGVPFEGGKADNYGLTLGSGTFIPGFEEQIVGHDIDEEFDVNVTFPEEYHSPELAGKAAVFRCTIHEIKVKEVPELDDEFAAEVSEFDTLEEYIADVRKELETKKYEELKRAAEDEVVDQAVANAQMVIAEPMLRSKTEQTASEFERRMSYQGISMEQYLQIVGQTYEQFLEQVKPQALKSTQTRLTLEAIAAKENITADEDDVTDEINKMAQAYDMEPDNVRNMLGEDDMKTLKMDIAVNKTAAFLFENGKAVEKKQEPEDEAAPEDEA